MTLAFDSVSSRMRRSDQPQPLGKAIRQLREKRGATQEALAYEAGITTGTLSLIERGQSNPAWGTVTRIAKNLGVSMSELGRFVDRHST